METSLVMWRIARIIILAGAVAIGNLIANNENLSNEINNFKENHVSFLNSEFTRICKGEAPNHSIIIKSECERAELKLSAPK